MKKWWISILHGCEATSYAAESVVFHPFPTSRILGSFRGWFLFVLVLVGFVFCSFACCFHFEAFQVFCKIPCWNTFQQAKSGNDRLRPELDRHRKKNQFESQTVRSVLQNVGWYWQNGTSVFKNMFYCFVIAVAVVAFHWFLTRWVAVTACTHDWTWSTIHGWEITGSSKMLCITSLSL